jgi:DNA polymerase-3 subunit beta
VRFAVDRDLLQEAASQAARILPAAPPHPVLCGLKLHASHGAGLEVSAYDYEVSAQCSVTADVAAEGIAVVPGRLLTEIARSLPAKPVHISTDETRLTLRCGTATFTLMLLPAEEYPELPGMPPLAGTIGSSLLATAVGQVAAAAGKDSTLPLLTGVMTEIGGEHLTLIATDRYRLAIRELTWIPAQPGLEAAVLIPARTLIEVSRAAASAAETALHLSAAGTPGSTPSPAEPGIAGFEAGGRRATTRLLSGAYPNVRSLIPSEFSCAAEVGVAAFAGALKRVALVAERNTPVRLVFSGGQVTLEAGTGDEAQASEELDVKFDGDGEFRVNFNPGYLADGLAATGTDTARIAMTTPARPAVITSTEDEPAYRYLLMPIRNAG